MQLRLEIGNVSKRKQPEQRVKNSQKSVFDMARNSETGSGLQLASQQNIFTTRMSLKMVIIQNSKTCIYELKFKKNNNIGCYFLFVQVVVSLIYFPFPF